MTIEPPIRAEPLHCVCVIVRRRPDGPSARDACTSTWGVSPDYPFCRACETAGHPWLPEQLTIQERKRP